VDDADLSDEERDVQSAAKLAMGRDRNAMKGGPNEATAQGDGLVVGLSTLAIIFQVLSFSRFVLLFAPNVATLMVAGPIASVMCLPFVDRRDRARLALFAGVLMAAALLWLYVFVANTGLYNDFRAIGLCLGALVAIPFAVLMRRLGRRRTLDLLFRIGLGYLALYLVLAFAVSAGRLLPASAINSVILFDFERGYRVFSCASLLGFLIFRVVAQLRRMERLAPMIVVVPPLVVAILYQQSRVAILLYGIISVAILLGSARVVTLLVYGWLAAYVTELFSLATNFDLIYDVLYGLNDPSLALRLNSVEISRDVFEKHTLLGLGFPTDEGFHQDYLRFAYFPEDLGIVGLYASMGLVGAVFVVGLLLLVARATAAAARTGETEGWVLVGCGFYVLLTTAFSINFYRGDASLLTGLMFASLVVGPSSVVPQRRSAIPLGLSRARRAAS
jgi:hypothetical protein